MRIVNGLIFLSFLLSTLCYAAESQPAKIAKVYEEQWFSLAAHEQRIKHSMKQLPESNLTTELSAALKITEEVIFLHRSTTYDKRPQNGAILKYMNSLINFPEILSQEIKKTKFENAVERALALKIYRQTEDLLTKISFTTMFETWDAIGKIIEKNNLDPQLKRFSTFIEDICKINNMPTPLIFIGYRLRNCSSFTLEMLNKSIIFINKTMLDAGQPERVIKGVIAHELGHLYYHDSERYAIRKKYASLFPKPDIFEIKYNHFVERRADLFAAQYGYGPDFASFLNSNKIIEVGMEESLAKALIELSKSSPSFTHPAIKERTEYLNALRRIPDLKTIYQPVFQPHGLSLIATPKNNQAGKIVESSAQPIRPQIQPATAATLNAQRALRALGALKKLPK